MYKATQNNTNTTQQNPTQDENNGEPKKEPEVTDVDFEEVK